MTGKAFLFVGESIKIMLSAGVVHSWKRGMDGWSRGAGYLRSASIPRSEWHQIAYSNCRVECVRANWHFLLSLAFMRIQMAVFDN